MWNIFNSTLLKIIIDTLSDIETFSNIPRLLFWPSILFLLNLIIYDFSWRGVNIINLKIQPLIKNDITQYAFSYVGKQSYQFFQNNFAGKISSNINILSNNIETALNQLSVHVIRCSALLIASLITMYCVNPQFFFVLLAWAIIFLCLSFIASKPIMKLAQQYAKCESEVSGLIVDSISNSQNVRIFACNYFELTNLTKTLLPLRDKFRQKSMFMLKFNIIQGLSITTLLGFMLYTLIKLIAAKTITIGDFGLILTLSIEVAWNVWWLTENAYSMINAFGNCKQAINSLFVPLEIEDKPMASALRVVSGRIVFHNVHFSYPGTESLFQNKSIVIEPGQKVGLVGLSGSGKTTFINLILRLYDINDGCIMIDGQNIKDVTQESLHNSIGMIPQDPSLFHRSLLDNIRYGNLKASYKEIIAAAERAHAHEFINELPEKYASLVGERGVKLSGGQRQRIAIARAMLKNAPILILDEATSQLDSVTEYKIQQALTALMQEKTAIVIAHRLSTLLHMDRILVFARGKIVEDGAHELLLAKGGLYKTLWDAQVGGFILDNSL